MASVARQPALGSPGTRPGAVCHVDHARQRTRLTRRSWRGRRGSMTARFSFGSHALVFALATGVLGVAACSSSTSSDPAPAGGTSSSGASGASDCAPRCEAKFTTCGAAAAQAKSDCGSQICSGTASVAAALGGQGERPDGHDLHPRGLSGAGCVAAVAAAAVRGPRSAHGLGQATGFVSTTRSSIQTSRGAFIGWKLHAPTNSSVTAGPYQGEVTEVGATQPFP